jgi:CHAT domain-containing protein
MRKLLSGNVVFAGLFVFTLTDGSGQDARFYGRRADHEFLSTGRTEDALKLYQRAYRAAVAASDTVFQYRFLNNIGACQLTLFRFSEAEQSLLNVRKMAEAAHDDQAVGSADGNLAGVYRQMDDLPAAEIYARESLREYSRTGKGAQRARAMMTLADILSREKLSQEGEHFFRAGIDAAIGAEDWASASAGWLHYGRVLLEEGRFDESERAFLSSYSLLYKSRRLNGEDAVLWNLSRLRLQRRDFKGALALINSAIGISPTPRGRIPPWRLYQTRADIELASGAAKAALQDARSALQWARLVRANIVPDNDDRVGMEGVLDKGVSTLIDAGNQVYLKTGDPKLLRETFEAEEENRAESLEEILPASSNWRARLSTPEYRYKLSQLLLEQRVALRVNSPESRERLARLQTELSQMESAAGATIRPQAGTVLDRVRRNLPPESALLSYRLGDRGSWLWAMDHGKLKLYRLPPKAILLAQIHDFEAAVQDNDTHQMATLGRRLYRDLLGGRQRSFEQSSQWFISLDEPLYNLAFPALVVEVTKNGPVYLTERKTIQLLPGAKLLGSPMRRTFANGSFVLAGDGIYNRADPRFGQSGFGKSGVVRPASWGMARLPGSGAEVRFAADLWPHAALLTGPQMTKDRLLKEIDRDPDVIHIASHVIEGQDRWHTGILALGMDRSGEPDLLTAREIQLHSVHSRLVVMTGCSSGSGEALPASGLMGLTRAWLAAGAGEVLATRRPTMDESGNGLIGSFYVHLLASRDGNVPQALREARQQMIARGGWRAEPRYWSSFFLIGVQ